MNMTFQKIGALMFELILLIWFAAFCTVMAYFDREEK